MKVFNKEKALRQIKLKQNKNTYIKKVSIVLSCFILLIGIMYFTFAKFEQNSEEYTLINGKVKYLGGDINIVSYNYDGTSNSLPPNKNEGYILTNINCEGATGEWDDVNWKLTVSELSNKVKCNLEFDKNSNYQIIKYNTNGGYLEEQYKKGTIGEQIGELPTPVRTGYTFAGWYKESTFTNKVETTTTIDATITNLYAKYSENTITINTIGESNVLDYAKVSFELPSGSGNGRNILGLAHDNGYGYSLWHYMNQDYFDLTAGAWGGKGMGYTNEDVTFTAKKALVGKFWSSYNFGAAVNVYKNGTLLFSTSISAPAFYDIQLSVGDTLRIQHSTSYDRTEWFLLINPSNNIDNELIWSINYQ